MNTAWHCIRRGDDKGVCSRSSDRRWKRCPQRMTRNENFRTSNAPMRSMPKLEQPVLRGKRRRLQLPRLLRSNRLKNRFQFWIKKFNLPRHHLVCAPTIKASFSNCSIPPAFLPSEPSRNQRRGADPSLKIASERTAMGNSAKASVAGESVGLNTLELVRALKSAASHSSAPYLLCVCPPSKAPGKQ